MKERFRSISAIWMEKEKKTIKECAKSVYDFLILLKAHNSDLFALWYEKGYSKKEALRKKLDINEDYFFKDLEKNKNKKHHDLGTTVSYWTGNENEGLSAAISFTIGGYGDKSFNKNSCVINLPSEGKYYELPENQESLKNLVVEYWKPDSILVNGEPVLLK